MPPFGIFFKEVADISSIDLEHRVPGAGNPAQIFNSKEYS